MACLSTCNIGFLLKDVWYLFETSELRNSNIYWGWSRQFAKKIYIFSPPERSTFIHTSQTCLKNNSEIFQNLFVERGNTEWIIKMLKSCGLLSLEVKKWFCCRENKSERNQSLSWRRKNFSVTFDSHFSQNGFHSFIYAWHEILLKIQYIIIAGWRNGWWILLREEGQTGNEWRTR